MSTASKHSYVSYYSLDEHGETIAENLKNAIIITSDEGEHPVMDQFLKMAQEKAQESEKDRQLKLHTALTSKGLEFKAIMLYKFGCDKAAVLFNRIVNGESIDSDPSERYELAHFFTKLYIAVSRAKRILYIVDTKEGYENFWKYFVEEDLWKQVISKLNLPDRDRMLVGYVDVGDISAMVVRLKENYNPREYANALFQKAKSEENSDTMRAALSAFREAQIGKRADECQAYIELFDRHYEKAGQLFYRMDDYEKALDAYWNGKCWSSVMEMADLVTDEVSMVRRHIARFMYGEASVAAFVSKWKESESLFQDYVRSSRERDLWIDVFNRLTSECDKLQPVDISATLVQNLDELADYAEWYDSGFATTRAMLHYKRAAFVNRNCKYNPESKDFKREDYLMAISLWEEKKLVQSKEYYTARKLTSSTSSEEIVWMDKLGESSEILSKYGDISMSEQIGAAGQNIVFTSLLSSDFEKAVKYPFPSDLRYRWARLYEKDPLRFLVHVVLEDFTLEKFFFISEKLHDGDYRIFAAALPSMVYDSIFRLKGSDSEGKPYWSYFQTELKNSEGYYLLRNADQITPQLEALALVLAENPDHLLASCFLDILFGKQYNGPRAERFLPTLKKIFDTEDFIREDFRITMRKNAYFSNYSKLTAEALDTLKDNCRKFVKGYYDNRKRVKADDSTIKTLGHIFETCISYSDSEPEYKRIVDFYAHYVHEKSFAAMKEWLLRKVNLYQLLEDGRNGLASFAKLKESLEERGSDVGSLVDELNREEACTLIVAVHLSNIPCIPEAGFYTAKLMYKHDLRADDFKMYCKIDTLRPNIDSAVKDSLDWYLGRNNIDVYAVKILSFVWENLYGHNDIANRYEDLLDNNRLAKLPYLVEYLKKRALLHYSYLKQNLFDVKQVAFDIKMSRDYLPSRHPIISEKNPAGDQEKKAEQKKELVQQPGSRSRSAGKVIDALPSSPSTVPGVIDPLKLQAITIGKKLKSMGLSKDQIKMATGLTDKEFDLL